MNEKRVLYHELEKPIKAFLKGKDIGIDKILYCDLIALNVYPNEAITFSIIVDGSLFDYISPENVFMYEKNKCNLMLNDLVYNNNVSEDFVVFKSSFFQNKKLLAYFKHKNTWLKVKEYYFSLDWYKDNDKRHFVLLENGQFAFVPNHKIKCDNKKEFNKNFKKIRKVYKV